jgi:hypothetical protein
MKVNEFLKLIDRYGDEVLDNELVVMTNDRSIGAQSCVYIDNIFPGFDWDHRKMLIKTKTKIKKEK